MLLSLLLMLLPPRLHVWVRRRLGQDLAAGASIGWGTLIVADEVHLAAGAKIGPAAVVRARHLTVGARSRIKALTVVSTHTVRIGADSEIAPLSIVFGDAGLERATFVMGDHSKIFPLCWLEPGYGILLGDRVGIGGHGLIFTHGSWSNYFHGAPVTFGSVTIEDRVWLPWRVFVMPQVTIGAGAIIAAGSVVTRSVPPGSLAAGSPATVIRERAFAELDDTALLERMHRAVEDFRTCNPPFAAARVHLCVGAVGELPSGTEIVLAARVSESDLDARVPGSVTVIDVTEERVRSTGSGASLGLASWLQRYGVRLDQR